MKLNELYYKTRALIEDKKEDLKILQKGLIKKEEDENKEYLKKAIENLTIEIEALESYAKGILEDLKGDEE